MNEEKPKIHWVSASEVIESQTREIERTYHSSRPKPRNRAMGFTGRDPSKLEEAVKREAPEWAWGWLLSRLRRGE